ncbi:MAG: hypothetical protein ABR543_00645 [Gemmatimonadaceae bacterium]
MKREARTKTLSAQRSATVAHANAQPPAPAYATAWAALAYALVTLSLAYPALTGQFLVNPSSDQYIAGYAFREFAAATLRETGGFPLWNPYLFGGMPYVAAMHGDIFYPTFLLRLLMTTDVAMTWGFIIHIFLAGLFTYVFLRTWAFGFFPALVGGVAYMLSGQIASLVSPGHDGKLFIGALFPLALWIVTRGVRDGRNWAWGALALTIGLAVLSPHPQLLQYLLLASGAFGLFCAFAARDDGEPLSRKVALRRLMFAAGAVVLGGAIGAIQYLPVVEYVPWSPRAGGVGYERATQFSMPLAELVNVYLPQFSGILDAYWGSNPLKLHGEYLGVVVLVLTGAAFGAGITNQTRKRFRWFWGITTIVALLWALGGNTPFFRLVYALVPGTKFFRAPSTIFFLVSFGVSMMAALGMERVLARDVGRKYALGWLIAGITVAVLATAGVFTNIATAIASPEDFGAAQANSAAVTLGAWRSFLFVAIAAGAVLAVLYYKIGAVAACWIFVVAAAADLWSIDRHYWMFSPPATTIFASDSIIEYLRKQEQPIRVLAFPVGQAQRDPFLAHDALMTHRIRNVLGYHGNQLGRYDLIAGREQGYNSIGNPNFWQLYNIRYLLTNLPEPPLPGAEKVLGPVKNAAGLDTYLYTMPGQSAPAWVTPVIVKAPDDAVLATVLNPGFDIRRAALFDTAAPVTGREITALPDTLPVRAKITTYEPGHIVAELDGPAPAGAALIVSENYYPGWNATVGGKPAGTGRADLTLIGVELPQGGRKVELTFSSRPYNQGKMITIGALGLSLMLLAAGILLGRGREGEVKGGEAVP